MDRRRCLTRLALAACLGRLLSTPAQATSFEHAYAGWDSLLRQHVVWLADGRQTRVDYAGLASVRAELQAQLAAWTAVTPAQFAAFGRAEQMAFLINAYNGFTIELVLTRYPALRSIKELGSLLQSPWKKRFFRLLGEERSLDWIEHEQLRARYADWRVHAAINCASIGCPALRPEAFTAARLEGQLEDGMARFMADRTRNRYANGRAEISAIFEWFRADFEQGHLGVRSLGDLLARYAEQLADAPADRARLRAGSVPVSYLDYDWRLNDGRR